MRSLAIVFFVFASVPGVCRTRSGDAFPDDHAVRAQPDPTRRAQTQALPDNGYLQEFLSFLEHQSLSCTCKPPDRETYEKALAGDGSIDVWQREYVPNVYCCRHFTRDFCDLAIRRGIPCVAFGFGCEATPGSGSSHRIAAVEIKASTPALRKRCLIEPQSNKELTCWEFARGQPGDPSRTVLDSLENRYNEWMLGCNTPIRRWGMMPADFSSVKDITPQGTYEAYQCECPGNDFVACGFDEKWYLKKYPEARNGDYPSALEHYRHKGRFESKKKHGPFSEADYLANPNVRKALADDVKASGGDPAKVKFKSVFDHYRKVGVCDPTHFGS